MIALQVEAPAKINLALEIVGVRSDGYHELDTVFATLELSDRLSWSQSSEPSVLRLHGDVGGMPVSTGEDNLVLRALRALEQASGRELPVHLDLEKRIPAGGGLGGGSGDAAALLFALNRSFKLGFTLSQLEALARPLGADVAFGIRGGVARGRGRGDELEPLPAPPARSVMLVFPPFPCPTGEVYRAWREDRPRPAAGCTEKLVAALREGRDFLPFLGNDLGPAAERVQPPLREIAQELESHGWGPVLLCGSGSTLSCWNADNAAAVEEALSRWRCKALLTRLNGIARS